MTESFGNPDLGAQRALHLALGVRQALPWSARLEVTAFHKQLWDLVVPTRATDASGNLVQLSNAGRGEVLGLEILLRRELARGMFGWLSYTLSRSIRQDDPTIPSYPVAPVRARSAAHPRARALLPAPGRLDPGDAGPRGEREPIYGVRRQRLRRRLGPLPVHSLAAAALGPAPGFFQADARLDKRFVFRNWMMSVYLDVQNVTNRENAEFRFPSYDCSAVSPIPSIPVLPALGLRAEW